MPGARRTREENNQRREKCVATKESMSPDAKAALREYSTFPPAPPVASINDTTSRDSEEPPEPSAVCTTM